LLLLFFFFFSFCCKITGNDGLLVQQLPETVVPVYVWAVAKL